MRLPGGLGLVWALCVLTLFSIQPLWAEEKPKTELEIKEADAAYCGALFNAFKEGEFQLCKIAPPNRPIELKDERNAENALDEWSVRSIKVLPAVTFRAFNSIFIDPESFGKSGAKCFDPGMALTLTKGPGKDREQATLLICLECGWVYAYQGKSLKICALSDAGKQALQNIYDQYFKMPEKK